MSNLVKVFYLGTKRRKADNVTRGNKHRVWNGFGDSIDVPEADAAQLLRFTDVWGDKAAFEAVEKERKAAERAVKRSAPAPEEREEEQEEEVELTGDAREKAIQGAILSLKPKSDKDYTGQGTPRIARLVEILGTNVSADEVDEAVKRLRHEGKLQ